MSRQSPYPTKDDDTVDSDSQELMPKSSTTSSTFASKKKNRLTVISSKYDLDGDGVLDEAEQAMRNADVANRGFLTNDEIYDIVQDQLAEQRKAGYMKRLIAGLICFVCILACSNLATSWASATLAKDLKSDDSKSDDPNVEEHVPAMKISSTNEIAAAQSVGDTFEATEMTDEELNYRRELVLAEIDEDPHSHAHRKLKKSGKCNVMDKSGCKSGQNQRIAFDSDVIPVSQFDVINTKCGQQRTVNIKRSWGDGANQNSRNDCICSRGTSIVVKEKKGKKGKNKNSNNNNNKNKNKKGKKVEKVKNKVIVFEQEDGNKWHADCDDFNCYVGGTTFQGRQGDGCLLNADQCKSGLSCEKTDKNVRTNGSGSRYGTCVKLVKTSTRIIKFAKRSAGCNYDYGRDACDGGMYCEPEDLDDYWGGSSFVTVRRSSSATNKRYGHNYGDCTNDKNSCARGYSCGRSNLNGSDRWNCFADDDADDILITTRSGSSTKVKYRGDGVGVCVKHVGVGQSCFDSSWCGNGNFCDGGVCVRDRRTVVNTVVNTGSCNAHDDCTNRRGCCNQWQACRPSGINGSDRWTCQ